MAQAITEVALGAAAIAAPFVLPGMGIAISATLANSLISAGASMALSGAMSGLAALTNNQGGLAVGTTTPIGPWGYIYGQQKVGGVEIFRQSNSSQGTSNNKELHRVYALACHPSVADGGGGSTPFQLRIDGKQVLLSRAGAGWASYSPTQIMEPITSMSRNSNGLVTFQIAGGIASLNGQEIQITKSSDNTLNGIWTVTQPNPANNTTFTFISGGTPTPAGTNPGGQCWTLYADYRDKIYIEFCNGNHTSTFQGLLSSGTNWSATDLCLGRTLVYVRMGWAADVFPSSIPNVSFVLCGKSNIYDPRTNSYGYTNNAALCIADFMSLPPTQGGFGLTIGTDIPTAQLIAAANICDEQIALANGGTISRYTCDTFFQLNQGRGTILQQLLSSCAGRLSYQGGQFSIFPGAWIAPTLQLADSDIIGTFKWKTRHSIRDTCNGVKGVYVSPENDYQQADFPPYMQDLTHGYDSNPAQPQYQGDPWLAEDNGERIFKDVHLPCTIYPATAQRLAKIELIRTRFQWRGTIRCTMKAYQAVALDVIQITHPRYTWVNETFEVLSSRFVWDKSGSTPTIAVELDLAQTDPSIYAWSIAEELTPQGYAQPSNVGNSVCVPPNGLTLYSGPATIINGIDFPSTITYQPSGVYTNSLYATWQTPNDTNVVQGGYVEIQYQLAGASGWTAWGQCNPSVNSLFITGVNVGSQYNVQIRAVNCAGVPSPWVQAGPETISSVISPFTYNGVPVAPTGTLTAQSTAGGTQITVNAFTPFVYPQLCVPSPAILTGLNPSQLYFVYYVDTAMAGGTITPIATQNESNFLNLPGYFLIGSLVTPAASTRYQPSSYADQGTFASVTPAAAYDNNTNTAAVVSGGYWNYGVAPMPVGGYYYFTSGQGQCSFLNFPAITTAVSTTLKVVASFGFSGTAPTPASSPNSNGWYGSIQVNIGGVWTSLTPPTGIDSPTATATYTLAIPTGTNLSTVSVVVEVQTGNAVADTTPLSACQCTASVSIAEIYIQ
jgi:hypothetical protein